MKRDALPNYMFYKGAGAGGVSNVDVFCAWDKQEEKQSIIV